MSKAKNRALEAEKARLQQEPEREAAHAHKEAKKRAAEATAAALEEAERKIQGKTCPGGSCVDTLRRFYDEDPATRMKTDLYAGVYPSSEASGPATGPRCKGKGKTPEMAQGTAERNPHDSNPFVTCSDGDGQNCLHCLEPRACKLGVPGAGGRGGADGPLSSGGEGPPTP